MPHLKPKGDRGLGTIEHVPNREKAYKAKIPVGTRVDSKGRSQTKYKTIGYFYTKRQAERALIEFSESPYDISSKVKTFDDLFQVWFADYQKTVTPSAVRCVTAAYSYCNGLYAMPLKKIGPGHIKDAMTKGYIISERGPDKGQIRYASKSTQERMKSLCNLMFDYATEHQIINYNPARAFKVTKLIHEIEDGRKVKKTYTPDQVQNFWKYMKDISNTDMILIALYTGLRPQELLKIKVKNVNMRTNTIVGGMKTDNGRNRTVPIHPLIRPLIKARLESEKRMYHTGMLFNDDKHPDHPEYTYDSYRRRFHEIMGHYHIEGMSPHCTRHTFATQAKKCKVDVGVLKRILGHSLAGDITESVYIHPSPEDMMKELCKLNYDITEE